MGTDSATESENRSGRRARMKSLGENLVLIARRSCSTHLGDCTPKTRQDQLRRGRGLDTGETIQIPAETVLKFRIAKACKDAVIGVK